MKKGAHPDRYVFPGRFPGPLQAAQWTEKVLVPVLGGVALAVRNVSDAAVPIVHVTLDRGSGPQSVDLCLCPSGLHKVRLIYNKSHAYIYSLYVLCLYIHL